MFISHPALSDSGLCSCSAHFHLFPVLPLLGYSGNDASG